MPCRHKPIHIKKLHEAFQKVHLEEDQKLILGNRIDCLLLEYKDRAGRYSCSFYFLRVMITVGSLIVPSLLTAQFTQGNVTTQVATIGSEVYWTVWVLSLLVTISNGILTLLKIDKKHFVMNTTFQHLLTECWQYVMLTGRYLGTDATHQSQYHLFCMTLEKIRMKQIKDEYYKVEEHDNSQQPSGDGNLFTFPFKGANGLSSKEKVNGPDPSSETALRKKNTAQTQAAGTALAENSKSPQESRSDEHV